MKSESKVTAAMRGAVGVMEFKGDVTGQSDEAITKAFASLQKSSPKNILFQFDDNIYINSAGIGLLINMLMEVKKSGGKAAACGLSAHFQKIFEMIGLTEYLTLYQTSEEALTTLQ